MNSFIYTQKNTLPIDEKLEALLFSLNNNKLQFLYKILFNSHLNKTLNTNQIRSTIIYNIINKFDDLNDLEPILDVLTNDFIDEQLQLNNDHVPLSSITYTKSDNTPQESELVKKSPVTGVTRPWNPNDIKLKLANELKNLPRVVLIPLAKILTGKAF